MPKLSIILPVYNAEQYLSDCLTSILNQSYSDFELIIIDDGSTDSSRRICVEYSQQDSRIRLYTQDNQGISITRNRGLDLVCGEFVTFVDSDDVIDLDMYASLMAKFSESDIDIVVCGHRVIQYNGEIEENKYGAHNLSGVEATSMILNDSVLPSFLWDKICRVDIWQGLRFPEGRIYEDLATTFRLFNKSRRVIIVDEVYYSYYRRTNSICLSAGVEKDMKRSYDLYKAFYDRYEFALSNHLYASMIPICAFSCLQVIINFIHTIVRYDWNDSYKDLAKKIIVLSGQCKNYLSIERKIEILFLKLPSVHRFLLKGYYSCKYRYESSLDN